MYDHSASDAFGALLGFAWEPRTRQARVDLSSVVNHSIWQDLASTKVTVPPPPTTPTGMSLWDGVAYLKLCYQRALEKLDHPKYPAKSAPYILSGILAKQEKAAQQAKTFLEDCHRLTEDGSHVSPLIWTYWRIGSLIGRGYSPYATKVVWSPRINEPSIRRFFYSESGYSGLGGRPLWPTAGGQLLALWHELERNAQGMSHSDVLTLWDQWYPTYTKLLAAAHEQRDAIRARIAQRVAKLDIDLWYTTDPLTHLKLNKRAAVLRPSKRIPKQ